MGETALYNLGKIAKQQNKITSPSTAPGIGKFNWATATEPAAQHIKMHAKPVAMFFNFSGTIDLIELHSPVGSGISS